MPACPLLHACSTPAAPLPTHALVHSICQLKGYLPAKPDARSHSLEPSVSHIQYPAFSSDANPNVLHPLQDHTTPPFLPLVPPILLSVQSSVWPPINLSSHHSSLLSVCLSGVPSDHRQSSVSPISQPLNRLSARRLLANLSSRASIRECASLLNRHQLLVHPIIHQCF